MSKPDYDTTLARMAGNIAAGLAANGNPHAEIAAEAVALASAIITEIKATELARLALAEIKATEPPAAAMSTPRADA